MNSGSGSTVHCPRSASGRRLTGERRGVRDPLEAQTMDMSRRRQNSSKTTCAMPAAKRWSASSRTAHRRRGGSGKICEEKFHAAMGSAFPDSYTPCANGHGNHRHERPAPKGDLGIQRDGVAREPFTGRPRRPVTSQMGLPVFPTTAGKFRDMGDETIPQDVAQEDSAVCQSGIALATLKDKSYLSVGSVSKGIAGSVVDPDFFSDFLACATNMWNERNLPKNSGEHLRPRRIPQARSLGQGKLYGRPGLQRRPAQVGKEQTGRGLGIRCEDGDDLPGSDASATRSWKRWDPRRGGRPQRDCAGFPGTRQWTDYLPNG